MKYFGSRIGGEDTADYDDNPKRSLNRSTMMNTNFSTLEDLRRLLNKMSDDGVDLDVIYGKYVSRYVLILDQRELSDGSEVADFLVGEIGGDTL